MNTKSYLPAVRELKKELEQGSGIKLNLLAAIEAQEVVAVRGQFDRVEDVLTEMEIEHNVYDGNQIGQPILDKAKIVLVNCPGRTANGNALEKFVSKGGWLVTTDWTIDLIEKAFPRTIQRTAVRTTEDVVEVAPLESLITAGMPDKSQFWLERESYTYLISDPKSDDIKELITSDEMLSRYGYGTVMVGFNWGKGKVFHSISHFILQKSKSGNTRLEDAYSSLMLLTNILAQRKAADTSAE